MLGVLVVLFVTRAEAITVSPIAMDDGNTFLILKGAFEINDDPAALVQAVASTGAKVVTFDSPGGNVVASMKFGNTIRLLGLSSVQIRAAECASACALAFLGGVERYAESGSIGVHRSSFASYQGVDAGQAVADIQHGISAIMAYISAMGADIRLLQLSLTIDSSDMRYLTSQEMADYRVTTNSERPTSDALAYGGDIAGSPSAPAAREDPQSSFDQIDRIALYEGLDFLGRDLSMRSEPDAPSCARACLSDSSCRAFTFNTMTRMSRGPNCFLKSAQGDLDGNSAAISGRLLSRLEPNASTYTFGTIDPHTSLYENRDILGFDLSSRPWGGAETEFACRMACVNEANCAAFTFVRTKKQCWLKGAVGNVRAMSGAVTGLKSASTFAPTHVPLD
ncbi:PAN domain-containing protein [Fulvimarina manganoxydans]|uniref:PAN domain-containing protein n=1 Tax=Fulvimarina manganoxydans TaxID=937218 RepID=A0A1W2D4E0_9HYPH|nr:PAN domain-containing protein [Fulvimarina manganoxydans]SMC92360.1 PAN domain-containing protein [Fulvimarina manganoxydans]